MEYGVFGDGVLQGADGAEREWPDLAVLGDPVDHSLSPVLHTAALSARNVDARYEAIRVAPKDLSEALDSASGAGVRGLNLTLPLKSGVLEHVEQRTDECVRIGAANTLVLRAGSWMAHNTDARGLAMALERGLGPGMVHQLRRCLILGAGGMARAAASALQALGAVRVEIASRDVDRARWAADFGARALDLSDVELAGVSLLVNCTPLGLHPGDPSPVDAERLDREAYVLDTTYAEQPSALLSAFSGQRQDGRAMLIAQAALAFSVWYGALPPIDEMAAAIGVDW